MTDVNNDRPENTRVVIKLALFYWRVNQVKDEKVGVIAILIRDIHVTDVYKCGVISLDS